MPKNRYRNDIQGLRAVAALLVAVYHIWFHRVSGAVDLFFFISAYFMTASLLHRLPTGGWAATVRFWKGLAKRLLPQAWAVLVAIAVVSYLVTPMTWWRQILSETAAAATFTVNWVLAANGTDYLHAGDVVSPVQHYWAMAVQMQMYLVWPLLLWLAVVIARQLHRSATAGVASVLSLLLVASLAYSVTTTASNQPVAYFDTFARAWEFAAGGLFAIVLPHLRPARFVRIAAGWLGLIGLLSFGMLMDVSGRFPGAVAAVPLTFAALIFIAGTPGRDTEHDPEADRLGVGRRLASRPLTWLGGISYGIYLWHWPIMTLWLARNGADQLSFSQGLVAIELSIALAWVTTRFVERPVRGTAAAAPAASDAASRRQRRTSGRRPWKPALALLSLLTVLSLTLGAWQADIRRLTSTAAASTNPGAAVLAADYDGPLLFDSLTPALTSLNNQWPQWSPTSCTANDTYGQAVSVCEYSTDGDDATDDAFTVLVVGSSHVDTWNTLLARLAEQQGMRLRVIVGPGCDLWAYSDEQAELTETTTDTCAALNQVAWDEIQTNPPDVLFTMGNRSVADSPEFTVDSRTITRMQQISALGVPVIALRDNPRFSTSPSTCVAEQQDAEFAVENCSVERSSVLAAGTMGDLLPTELQADPLVVPMDLSDLFCSEEVCPPAIGGVLVYLDANHPTRTYVETLAPQFNERFTAALDAALSAREESAVAVSSSEESAQL